MRQSSDIILSRGRKIACLVALSLLFCSPNEVRGLGRETVPFGDAVASRVEETSAHNVCVAIRPVKTSGEREKSGDHCTSRFDSAAGDPATSSETTSGIQDLLFRYDLLSTTEQLIVRKLAATPVDMLLVASLRKNG